MKNILTIYTIGLAVSLVVAWLMNDHSFTSDFLTILGMVNLVMALLAILIGLVAFAFDAETAKAILAAGALFLLTGTLTCSLFPIQLNLNH